MLQDCVSCRTTDSRGLSHPWFAGEAVSGALLFIVMAYTVMAYIVMACIVIAYRVMAYIVLAYV